MINDLVANALGIATLAPEQFFTLNPGQPRPGGNQAQIAAGTGLGMAMLFQDGAGYRVSASEDGHMDFAPRGEAQIALLRYLTARHGHASVEWVVSGPGLANEAAIRVKALDLFISAYGAAAGNLALMALATGGVYIGGGIATKLIEAFPNSSFMAAFTDKGRFAGLLGDMPMRTTLEPNTALRGAASHALAAT